MTDAIQELKVRAEILHGRIKDQQPTALARLRVLPEFRRSSDDQLGALGSSIRRRHCLNLIAAEFGFENGNHARRVLSGEGAPRDFGKLLWRVDCTGNLNLWYKTYGEAAEIRQARQGYLLAYQRHFLVVDRYYIEELGLDPDDSDWRAIGFDWVRPKDSEARRRLYAKLVAGLPRTEA